MAWARARAASRRGRRAGQAGPCEAPCRGRTHQRLAGQAPQMTAPCETAARAGYQRRGPPQQHTRQACLTVRCLVVCQRLEEPQLDRDLERPRRPKSCRRGARESVCVCLEGGASRAGRGTLAGAAAARAAGALWARWGARARARSRFRLPPADPLEPVPRRTTRECEEAPGRGGVVVGRARRRRVAGGHGGGRKGGGVARREPGGEGSRPVRWRGWDSNASI
jgi:hypothetical protein